jgi:hypothetical protein
MQVVDCSRGLRPQGTAYGGMYVQWDTSFDCLTLPMSARALARVQDVSEILRHRLIKLEGCEYRLWPSTLMTSSERLECITPTTLAFITALLRAVTDIGPDWLRD